MKVEERFCRYVKVHTTSNEKTGSHPSFGGEFDLARMLVEELQTLGLVDATVSDQCYVYASLPASPGYEGAPKLALIAHMDTSPDAYGNGVNPIFHPNYDGKDVVYPNANLTMKVSEFPFLKELEGQTLITSDGTTLLGADDKAGIAEIMTLLEDLINRDIPHGKICIAFTPDEEIGEGTDGFSLTDFDADFGYTVDGGDIDTIEFENFNAAGAEVIVMGRSVHPGDAKDRMINSMKVAMQFQKLLPDTMCPECTEGYEGFIHLCEIEGRVGETRLQYILRDHDAALLEEKKGTMQECAKQINNLYQQELVSVHISDSYRNMKEKILPHMHLIESAKKAIEESGFTPKIVPIRGGTDGAVLSYMGLPCPNLGTGGFNYHGNYECITVEKMNTMVDVLISIVKIYSKSNELCEK